MGNEAISLNREDAFKKILLSIPQLSSDTVNWSGLFLAYYDRHPGWETPQSSFQQHALEIITITFMHCC
jgi:AraC family transcriptional regulator